MGKKRVRSPESTPTQDQLHPEKILCVDKSGTGSPVSPKSTPKGEKKSNPEEEVGSTLYWGNYKEKETENKTKTPSPPNHGIMTFITVILTLRGTK